VRHLLDLDARGAARDLSVEGCWKMMFGVYNSFDFLDIALSGWPVFDLMHRTCRSYLGDRDLCATDAQAFSFLQGEGGGSYLIAARAYMTVASPVLGAQAALMRLESANVTASSSAADKDRVL
ncbi:unnamed protein product, partial [Polarella glacialis]